MAIMDYAPFGVMEFAADKRQAWLEKCIESEGCAAEAVGGKGGKAVGCLFLPIARAAEESDLRFVRDGGFAFYGKKAAGFEEGARKRGIRAVDLLSYEPFVQENAEMTAEAALGMLLLDSPKRLADMKVAILGSGRIAFALAGRLLALKAGEVIVAARNPRRRAEAEALGAASRPLPIGSALGGCCALFNTVPAMVAAKGDLEHMERGALCYELASEAGFPFEEAAGVGLKPVMASGLPGKLAWQSAALLVWSCAKKFMEEECDGFSE
jgi:hypothetical protein